MLEMPLANVAIPAPAGDEEGLIARAQRDPQAFAELYRGHYAAIAGYVYRRTGDGHATEDAVAEVFLTALRWLPRYRYRGVPVRAWLYRIASTVVNRWARRHRREVQAQIHGRGGQNAPAGSSEDDRDELDRARRALLRLPPKYQTVLSLYYFEELSVEHVALAIGCRTGTVKSRLSRAREALRQQLR